MSGRKASMLTQSKPSDLGSHVRFDADRLMDEAGLEVLVATSEHNVQYLPGGHRAFYGDRARGRLRGRHLAIAYSI
jgi:hypothetical protein